MSNEYNQLPNPQSGEVQAAVSNALAEEKKKKRKKRLIILAVVIAVIVVIGILSSGGKDNGKTVESIDGKPASTQSANAETDPAEEPTEGELKVKPGNAVSSDELKISFISCDTDSKNANKYVKPDKGNKLVRAEFKFENISDSDVILNNIECYADDKKCDVYYGADDDASPTLESVSPGRSFDAVIYFQVPEDSKVIEFEYEDDFWNGEKTVFVAE